MAGLDQATSGSILFEDRDMADMSESELIDLRRHRIGFVFQSFGLLPLLSAFENVELPLRISGAGSRERERRTNEALEMVGLAPRSRHRPYELSGGEQQRVAIARAMVIRPSLMLADEPTGELDSSNARAIFGLFAEMVRDEGISVVAATHDSTLLNLADEVLEMRDGRVVERQDAHSPLPRLRQYCGECYDGLRHRLEVRVKYDAYQGKAETLYRFRRLGPRTLLPASTC